MHPRVLILLLLALCGLATQPVRAQFVTPLVAPSHLRVVSQPTTTYDENTTKIYWHRGDGTHYAVFIVNGLGNTSTMIGPPNERPFPTEGNFRMEPASVMPTPRYNPNPTYLLRSAAYQNAGDTTAAVLNTTIGNGYQVMVMEFSPDSAGNKSGYYTQSEAVNFLVPACRPTLNGCIRINDTTVRISWSVPVYTSTSGPYRIYAANDSTTYFTNSATTIYYITPQYYTFEYDVYNVRGSTPIYYKLRASSGANSYEGTTYDTKAFTVREAPLPVTLVSFEALRLPAGVRLSWATASELNNKGFELQRSADGQTWRPIQFLPGAGTTAIRQQYQAVDANTEAAYYRLAQQDLNGQLHFSPVRYVPGAAPSASLQAYPNPCSTEQPVTVLGTEPDKPVQLLSATGQLVRESTGSTLSTTGLLPGVYLLRQNAKATRLIIK